MYAKLFTQILESTIWTESLETKILWITMLAKSDAEGLVDCTVPGLAKLAGISIKECEEGLRKFKSPDRYSRTQESEGRRIVDADEGWILLNYTKYRELASKERKREMTRKRVEKHRNEKKGVTPEKRKKKKCNGSSYASASDSDQSNIKVAEIVFEHWKETFGKSSRFKLDDKRKKLIVARSRDGFSADDLCQAISNAKNDNFLMGREPGKPTVYDKLSTLIKSAEQVERLMGLRTAQAVRKPNGVTPIQPAKSGRSPAQFAAELERERIESGQ